MLGGVQPVVGQGFSLRRALACLSGYVKVCNEARVPVEQWMVMPRTPRRDISTLANSESVGPDGTDSAAS